MGTGAPKAHDCLVMEPFGAIPRCNLSPRPLKNRPQTSLETIFIRFDETSAEHLSESREGASANLSGSEFEVDLRAGGCFTKRVTENKVVDRHEQRYLLFIRQRRFSERFEALLYMAHRVEPRGDRQHSGQRPWVTHEDCAGSLGDFNHRAPPVFRN